jgi:hypothetical protein
VGHQKLVGEIIKLEGDTASIQVISSQRRIKTDDLRCRRTGVAATRSRPLFNAAPKWLRLSELGNIERGIFDWLHRVVCLSHSPLQPPPSPRPPPRPPPLPTFTTHYTHHPQHTFKGVRRHFWFDSWRPCPSHPAAPERAARSWHHEHHLRWHPEAA